MKSRKAQAISPDVAPGDSWRRTLAYTLTADAYGHSSRGLRGYLAARERVTGVDETRLENFFREAHRLVETRSA